MMKRTLRSEPTTRATCASLRRALALVLALAAVPAVADTAAGDVARLYGPQPPADATYLRVVNLSTRTAKVSLPSGTPLLELPSGAATRLDVVRPGTPLRVTVDASVPRGPAGGAKVASTATAGQTITVAIAHDDASGWHATSIAAPAAGADALRAQLRLFNFADGCDGKVVLSGSPASAVFAHVAPGDAASRSVNPVTATLVAVCGKAVSPPFALPRLAAGQSYSLFLSGSAAQPLLSGAPDALAWPGREP
ncbi:alginate O-acetyltransferase AlgF [Trinickia acidisoli]|uniref:alginate O-acetyltransferase AlgF n=1 Tax=Trinickia acidisoli TaxID=2767482 RepID=UPI001A8E9541|nr:alginate O-acetyltransferase AlgF [Trinickia acidisoli]